MGLIYVEKFMFLLFFFEFRFPALKIYFLKDRPVVDGVDGATLDPVAPCLTMIRAKNDSDHRN